jgi:purine-nucleoside/S-methyl-5'-thioadenosine phosphorylase / adenosine deaminase
MKLIERDLPGARVVFSTRLGGVSEGPYESLNLGILTDDEQSRVTTNRERLAEGAGLDRERVAMGWQVHGTEVREWLAPPNGGGYATPGAELDRVDGHLTREPEVGLLVLVADCLPVALATSDTVAMLHCGWRGLAGGIVESALARFDEPPAAVIGPGIGRCCYEVGPEVLRAFEDLDGVAEGRMLDLKAVARRKLEAAGVEQIDDVDLCTSCREDLFFSHRRDDGVTGRQGGLAWLTSRR